MRTRHLPRLAALLAAALLAGCETAEDAEVEPSAETEPVPPSPAPPIDVAPADEAGATGAMLTVAESPEHGRYVADGEGRALYLLEGGGDCYDACAGTWPPLLAPRAMPMADAPGLQADRVGTAERRDGSTQVTYGGHALYHYSGDSAPGQTNGQDVTDEWGEWYLVTPAGEALEREEGEGSS